MTDHSFSDLTAVYQRYVVGKYESIEAIGADLGIALEECKRLRAGINTLRYEAEHSTSAPPWVFGALNSLLEPKP